VNRKNLGPAVSRTGTPLLVPLQDGRQVKIRPIVPADLNALGAFFTALTPATRRLRFLAQVHEVPSDLLESFSRVDHGNHVAFVAEPCDSMRPLLIGEARYVRGPQTDCAELALVVAEAWRKVGLGSALTSTLLRSARAGGVRRLCGDALAENVGILRLMRSFGARWVPTADLRIVQLCVETEPHGTLERLLGD